jgi:hypothetical protein
MEIPMTIVQTGKLVGYMRSGYGATGCAFASPRSSVVEGSSSESPLRDEGGGKWQQLHAVAIGARKE